MKTPLPSKLVIVQFVRTVEILRYTSDYALSCFKLKIKIVVCCHISENMENFTLVDICFSISIARAVMTFENLFTI